MASFTTEITEALRFGRFLCALWWRTMTPSGPEAEEPSAMATNEPGHLSMPGLVASGAASPSGAIITPARRNGRDDRPYQVTAKL